MILSLLSPPDIGNAKMFERKSKTIHTESPPYHKPWITLSSDMNESLEKLAQVMAKSNKGKMILERAKAKALKEGLNLSEILIPGEKSYTDITLVRKFSKDNPQEIQYQSHLKVFINRNLNVQDAVMDMAHELIHYTFRDNFNPYRANFNLKDFISSTIEGRGGEVDAYMAECSVFFELFDKSNASQSHCHRILNHKTQQPDRQKTVEIFYRLGSHYHPFLKKIKKHNVRSSFLKHISPKQTLLMNATYDLPYPIAAVQEYENILKKTCENEYKRLNVMPRREISSVILKGYRKRCNNFF